MISYQKDAKVKVAICILVQASFPVLAAKQVQADDDYTNPSSLNIKWFFSVTYNTLNTVSST